MFPQGQFLLICVGFFLTCEWTWEWPLFSGFLARFVIFCRKLNVWGIIMWSLWKSDPIISLEFVFVVDYCLELFGFSSNLPELFWQRLYFWLYAVSDITVPLAL